MSILVGSTVPAFKMDADWHHWLDNAERIATHGAQAGHQVEFLALLQADARGDTPFEALIERLETLAAINVPATCQRFTVDIGEDEITTWNRLGAICTGRNLIVNHALRHGHEWIYFADADIHAADDILPRLLELDWPVCGGHVPTYCLDGSKADGYPGDSRWHWTTAGSLLVRRDVFRRVPWRFDPDDSDYRTDDPATQAEMKRLGWRTLIRHDVICEHHPASIGPLEQRGLDLTVYR